MRLMRRHQTCRPMHAVKHRWSSPCYFTQKHTFETRGAKAPENESSWERKFHVTFAPGSESSRERKSQGAKVPGSESSTYGTFALGNKSYSYPNVCLLKFSPKFNCIFKVILLTKGYNEYIHSEGNNIPIYSNTVRVNAMQLRFFKHSFGATCTWVVTDRSVVQE